MLNRKTNVRLMIFGAAIIWLAIILIAVSAANAADLPRGDLTLKGQGAASLACQEDEPCWNWAKMGNHQRGITTVGGRRVIVGPCKFQRFDRQRRIDWTATAHLRGDRAARNRDC